MSELNETIRRYVLSIIDERIDQTLLSRDAMRARIEELILRPSADAPERVDEPEPIRTELEWWNPSEKMPEITKAKHSKWRVCWVLFSDSVVPCVHYAPELAKITARDPWRWCYAPELPTGDA